MSAISSDRCSMSSSWRGTRGGSRSAYVCARSLGMAERLGHGSRKVNGSARAYSEAMAISDRADLRRLLPAVDEALRENAVQALCARFGRPLVVRAVRARL